MDPSANRFWVRGLAKVLKDRRSPRERGRVGTNVRDATRRDSIRSRFDLDSGIRTIGRAPSSAVVSSVSAAIAASAVAATSPARDASGERRVRRGEAGGRNERMNRRRPRTAPGEKVLKDRRSRRERGRVGTSVKDGADRARRARGDPGTRSVPRARSRRRARIERRTGRICRRRGRGRRPRRASRGPTSSSPSRRARFCATASESIGPSSSRGELSVGTKT